MENKIYISIVIPAYNEEFRIHPTLDDIHMYMSRVNYEYEVIVVDDGSRDMTVEVLKEYESKLKNFRVLRNEVNMGKGYSVKRGMLEARGELKLFMDADNSVKISNLDRFILEIQNGFDVVIGSIEIEGAVTKDNNQWYRRVLGRLSKVLIRTIATPGIYDTQRGFKLFTKEATENIFPLLTIYRWGFDIEVLAIALNKDIKIKEIPVEWDNVGGSSVNLVSYIRTLVELVRIKCNLLFKRY